MRMHRLRRHKRVIRWQCHPVHILWHVLLLLSRWDLFNRYHLSVSVSLWVIVYEQVPGQKIINIQSLNLFFLCMLYGDAIVPHDHQRADIQQLQWQLFICKLIRVVCFGVVIFWYWWVLLCVAVNILLYIKEYRIDFLQ